MTPDKLRKGFILKLQGILKQLEDFHHDSAGLYEISGDMGSLAEDVFKLSKETSDKMWSEELGDFARDCEGIQEETENLASDIGEIEDALRLSPDEGVGSIEDDIVIEDLFTELKGLRLQVNNLGKDEIKFLESEYGDS